MKITAMLLPALVIFCAGYPSMGASQGMMQGNRMMGGGGTGAIEIPGQPPPVETEQRLQPGYRSARITCTQCHALPNPDRHRSSEWPTVIARMEGYIRSAGKALPSRSALDSIVRYYQAKSK